MSFGKKEAILSDAKEYDLIVVGAGMAGIIAAARIAEKGIHPKTGDRLRIALIEAGPHLLNGTVHHGYGNPRLRQLVPQVLWEEFSNGPLVKNWPWSTAERMKIVGGCSVHWGAHANAPFDVDYENWSAMGIDWTKQSMKEALDDVVQGLHFHADPDEAFSRGERMFREAAQSLGYKVEPLLTPRKNCFYCGFHNSGQGCKYDVKGTSLWYLPTALANGVELIDNAEVKKVMIEKQGAGGIVKGVYYEKDGQIQQAQADKVIVSGGAYGSPVLLAKSGYGPKEELGNDLIVENPNVGRNLDGDTGYRIRLIADEPIKEAGRGTTGAL
jgi:choline dehydrogenase-like flavoprotein